MKFTRYLDAVVFCRYNDISYLQIERHGEYWNCYWLVPKKPTKRRSKLNKPDTQGESCPA